jgi:hypothetical protein
VFAAPHGTISTSFLTGYAAPSCTKFQDAILVVGIFVTGKHDVIAIIRIVVVEHDRALHHDKFTVDRFLSDLFILAFADTIALTC